MSRREEFLRKLGRDPANPQAAASSIYGTPLGQVPGFNTSRGIASPTTRFPGTYGNLPGGTAPQLPAPRTGLLVPGTITNLYNRPIMMHNPVEYPGLGANERLPLSTTLSSSFTIEDKTSPHYGKEVLIPTVVNGKLLSNAQAMEHFRQTGEHLGIFDTPENADRYANWLHGEQTRRMGISP